MAQGFFAIRDHRDMLAKAEREFVRMRADLNTDTLFNFFVTEYHVIDYVKASAIPVTIIDKMYADPDFKMCRFICNKGKHLELTKEDKDAQFFRGYSGAMNSAPINSTPLNGGTPDRFVVDGRNVDVFRLGQDMIVKWNEFFVTNGI